MRGGTEFHLQTPFGFRIRASKSWYRPVRAGTASAEDVRHGGELAPAAFDYPAQSLYHAWLQMLLNMDRNTLWGAAGGMVFENERSWDVRDRFESVGRISPRDPQRRGSLAHERKCRRDGVQPAELGTGKPDAIALRRWAQNARRSQAATKSSASSHCPPVGARGFKPASEAPAEPRGHYTAARHRDAALSRRGESIPATGALLSLRLKPSDREVLAGPANVIVAERSKKPVSPGDHMVERSERIAWRFSSGNGAEAHREHWSIATVVEGRERPSSAAASCGGRWCFYHDCPRIEFETELNDIPDRTVSSPNSRWPQRARSPARSALRFSRTPRGRKPTPRCRASAKGNHARVRWSTTRWMAAASRCWIKGLNRTRDSSATRR